MKEDIADTTAAVAAAASGDADAAAAATPAGDVAAAAAAPAGGSSARAARAASTAAEAADPGLLARAEAPNVSTASPAVVPVPTCEDQNRGTIAEQINEISARLDCMLALPGPETGTYAERVRPWACGAAGIAAPAASAIDTAASAAPAGGSSARAARASAATAEALSPGLVARARAPKAPTSSSDQNMGSIAQQVLEVSARLDLILADPEPETGTAEETLPQQRAPASTIGQTFQPESPEGSVASSVPALPSVIERDAEGVDALEGEKRPEKTGSDGLPETQREIDGLQETHEPKTSGARASESPRLGSVPVVPGRGQPEGTGRTPARTPREEETGRGSVSETTAAKHDGCSHGIGVMSRDEEQTAGARDGAGAGETKGDDGADSSVPACFAPYTALQRPLKGAAKVTEGGEVLDGMESKLDDTRPVEATAEVRGCLVAFNGAQATAVDGATAEKLAETTGELGKSVPTAGDGPAPPPVSTVEAEAGAGSYVVVGSGEEKGAASAVVPAAPGGGAIKPKQVRRARDISSTCQYPAPSLDKRV